MSIDIQIWSDIACPWCYIGKRRFERALEQFPQRDQVTVTWRSFQLDPTLPERSDLDEIDYLHDRQLVQVDKQPTGRWFAELTRIGVDLAEYTIPCEPGIARPAKYW